LDEETDVDVNDGRLSSSIWWEMLLWKMDGFEQPEVVALILRSESKYMCIMCDENPPCMSVPHGVSVRLHSQARPWITHVGFLPCAIGQRGIECSGR